MHLVITFLPTGQKLEVNTEFYWCQHSELCTAMYLRSMQWQRQCMTFYSNITFPLTDSSLFISTGKLWQQNDNIWNLVCYNKEMGVSTMIPNIHPHQWNAIFSLSSKVNPFKTSHIKVSDIPLVIFAHCWGSINILETLSELWINKEVTHYTDSKEFW